MRRFISVGIFALGLYSFTSSAQQVVRRHFILAYDTSTPFVNASNGSYAYKQALTNLFSNRAVRNFHGANQENIIAENNNGIKFFDEELDEISLCHFNVAENEFDRLRWTALQYQEEGIVNEFSRKFLKIKKHSWSEYRTHEGATLKNYISEALSFPKDPPKFGNGVTMSNFVYPLVLNRVESQTAAEEYILIILSDFLTGSMLGNTKDLDRVRDIYMVPYETDLPSSSPVNMIKRNIDYLASQYYKLDFFQYSFKPSIVKENADKKIAVIGLKIKPNVGAQAPEDLSLFVNGNLSLNQRDYQSKWFQSTQTGVKFTHNEKLVPTELRMVVSISGGEHAGTKVFDEIVASRGGAQESWSSSYTSDSDILSFDESNLVYNIPSLRLPLDTIVNQRDFQSLNFKYVFNATYHTNQEHPLRYILSTERMVPIDNINYATKATILIFQYVLPGFLSLIAFIILLVYGRPKRLFFRLDGYLDSFETIDYKTIGKLITPYQAWDVTQQNEDFLVVNGEVVYSSKRYWFNWNPKVYLRLVQVQVPDGFEIILKESVDAVKEFGLDTTMTIKKHKANKLKFVVGIRQNDILVTLPEPQLIKFRVEAEVKHSIAFFKSELQDVIDYNFHVGEDLGDVWVGFDPGTTGSCVAAGSSTDNILLSQDRFSNTIEPSMLSFELKANVHINGEDIPDDVFKSGEDALRVRNLIPDYITFQSIKKLLGYKDVKTVAFKNGSTLQLKGKELAALLVRGLFNNVNSFFNKPDIHNQDYLQNGLFSPKRAVVAIPNNFTITKIQDMVDCISNIKQFREVRYVYEAEAVLFYYLSNYKKLTNGSSMTDSETIMVFDMGGATINATVLTVDKVSVDGRSKFNIDFLGKIGYGIGGDTIDYCIIKFLLSFTKEFPDFKSISIENSRAKLASLALELKIEIIKNYNKSSEYLILATVLQRSIKNHLGVEVKIVPEISDMYNYFLKQSGSYKLFEHALFKENIYSNVMDAVFEAVNLSEVASVDKIIFSGRSTAFPRIKETVESQLGLMIGKPIRVTLNLEESKEAVALGACWYGINKNSVRLNNLKTNASFGFKRTQSADRTDVKFHELVEMGRSFDTSNDGIDSYQGSEDIQDDFAFDGGKVNFYQVMGQDSDAILSNDQRHKFSKIASIKPSQITNKVAMKVNENDEVDCAVVLQSNRTILEKGVVADQEIDDANAEHYTWAVR